MKKQKLFLLLSLLFMASCSSDNERIHNANMAADTTALKNITTIMEIKFISGSYNYTKDDKTFVFNYSDALFKVSYNEKNVITSDEENLTNNAQQYTITESMLGNMIIDICKEDIGNASGTLTVSLDNEGVMILKYYNLLSGIDNDIVKYNFATKKIVE